MLPHTLLLYLLLYTAAFSVRYTMALGILVGLNLLKTRVFLLTSVTLCQMMNRKAPNTAGNLSKCVSSRGLSFLSLKSLMLYSYGPDDSN